MPTRDFISSAGVEPLARVTGVHLICLQKGYGSEQLTALNGRFPVQSFGPLVDETSGAFMDTAAILHNLEVLITADSAIAHLAGALGLPVWTALSFSPDWRWLLERSDSPWYPTMRLFRQRVLGDWTEVFTRMAEELRGLVAQTARRPLLMEVSPGDFLDRLIEVEVEVAQTKDPTQVARLRSEVATLQATHATALQNAPELAQCAAELREIHKALWQLKQNEAAVPDGLEWRELERHRASLRRAAENL